jgi:hypothetical protein
VRESAFNSRPVSVTRQSRTDTRTVSLTSQRTPVPSKAVPRPSSSSTLPNTK